ncbi:precorrin-6y C5,15-methyltransferase (decarboxylating) subunit CbiE [Gordonia aichiensis]|uniref:precorrin-6y C5,15-methyltransferase (decarboxylating) subunit CbiE n=1 Tax=Gordonia aichiensis TaxID=36820 RepID=UPI0032673613
MTGRFVPAGFVPARFVIVGIGADGWDGLAGRARTALLEANTVYGSARQLALLDDAVTADRIAWRSPMSAHLRELLTDHSPADDSPTGEAPTIHVLASGDPMFHGVGSSIVKAVGRDRVTVIPAPSSISLAAAELGWDLAGTRIVSAVTAPPEAVVPELSDGVRILVLSRDGSTPAALARICRDHGFGWTTITVLANLGGPDQHLRDGLARTWDDAPSAPLNVVALDCVGPARSSAPGLPDDDFENDGQLTKVTVRALTVSALRPAPGQLMWDVGAGSGSVGIEWLRASREGRVIAFEADAGRAAALVRNADRHGVGHRLTLAGPVPASLAQAPDPDTVFLGGGVDADVLDAAWGALLPGGRLVGNAVAVETQELFVAAHRRLGGTLTRLAPEHHAALGRLHAWRPALPIIQWVAVKPAAAQEDS